MKVFYLMIVFITSSAFSKGGEVYENVKILAKTDKELKFIKEGNVYSLPISGEKISLNYDCTDKIFVPSDQKVSVQKATKKQLKMDSCRSEKKKK